MHKSVHAARGRALDWNAQLPGRSAAVLLLLLLLLLPVPVAWRHAHGARCSLKTVDFGYAQCAATRLSGAAAEVRSRVCLVIDGGDCGAEPTGTAPWLS